MRNIKSISSLLPLLILSGCIKVISPQKAKSPVAVQIVTESPNYFRAIVWSDVCFSSKKHYLTSICNQQLTELMTALRVYPKELPIKIVGYQDNVLDTESAKDIADQQASVIARVLWQHGFSVKRFIIQAAGAKDFLGSNRNIGSSCENRRVEITVEREIAAG